MKPIDIPTGETAAFIAAQVPVAATIVEVGCGAGQVAHALALQGYKVIGVDSDAAMVARAVEIGANVVHAQWPDFTAADVDAIVFTRSLHHIDPLDAAVVRARELLRPAGKLIIEDFAFDEIDDATLAWFMGLICSPRANKFIEDIDGEFVTGLRHAADPRAHWNEEHDHELHTIHVMQEAVAVNFTLQRESTAPYLYRYLLPVLPDTAVAAQFLIDVLQQEVGLGRSGEISLIGRRLVAEVSTATP